MKINTISKLFFVILVSFLPVSMCAQVLFPVQQGTVWGYRNLEGQWAIKPSYFNAGKFNEGLAPVRIGGLYGFIDASGKVIIKPQFDYAETFHHGLAAVWVNGKRQAVNNNGKLFLDGKETEVYRFWEGTFFAYNKENIKIVRSDGSVLVDSISQVVEVFDSLAVVYSRVPHSKSKGSYEFGMAVCSYKSGLITPRLKYSKLFLSGQGYSFGVSTNEQKEAEIIDAVGNVIALFPLNESVMRSDFYSFNRESLRFEGSLIYMENFLEPNSMRHQWYDLKGKLLYSSKEEERAEFSRFIFRSNSGYYRLANERGEIVSPVEYLTVAMVVDEKGKQKYQRFNSNGLALVEDSKSWMLIDTSGKILSRFPSLFEDNCMIDEKYVYHKNSSGKLDIMSLKKSRPTRNLFLSGHIEEFKNKVIVRATIKGDSLKKMGISGKQVVPQKEYEILLSLNGKVKSYWLNESNKYQLEYPTNKDRIDIDFKERPYFYALRQKSEIKKDELPKYLAFNALEKDSFHILIDTIPHKIFRDKYEGLNVWLVNLNNHTPIFDTNEGCLDINVEVQDQTGEWVSINNPPRSFCGHSYGYNQMEFGEIRRYVIPVFNGVVKTKMRISCSFMFKEGDGYDWQHIISKEFDGYINPGQLWRTNE